MKKKDLYDIALDEMHLQDKRQQEKRDQEVKEKTKVRKILLVMNIRKEFKC